MSMQKFSVALLAAAALSGCVTAPGYRSGVGDYYYGSPSTAVYDYGYGGGGYGGYGYGYGAPYGSLGYGYGSGWGGSSFYSLGFGSPFYGGYGGYGLGGYGGYYGGGYYGGGYYGGGHYPGNHPRPPRPRPDGPVRRPGTPEWYMRDDGTRYQSRYQGGSNVQTPLRGVRGDGAAAPPASGGQPSRYPGAGNADVPQQRGQIRNGPVLQRGQLTRPDGSYRPGGLRPGATQLQPGGARPNGYMQPQQGYQQPQQRFQQPQQRGQMQQPRGQMQQPTQQRQQPRLEVQQRPAQMREAPRQSAPVAAPARRVRSVELQER